MSMTFSLCGTLAKQTQASSKVATTSAEKRTCHNVANGRILTTEEDAPIYTTASCVSCFYNCPGSNVYLLSGITAVVQQITERCR